MKTSKNILSVLSIVIAFLLVPSLLTSCQQKADAQKVYKVGLMSNNPNGLKNVQGFRDEMETMGYREGENIEYVFSGEATENAELESELKKMIDGQVDLIFTAGTPTGVAAYHASKGSDVPIVFGVIADPVAAGVMTDTSKPGGNMTGVRISNNQGRRLELLQEIAPQIRRVLVPYNPDDAAPVSAFHQVEQVSSQLNLEIVETKVRNKEEMNNLLSHFPQDIDAIFMLPDSLVSSFLKEIVAISHELKIPVSGPTAAQLTGGALTVYGIIHTKAGAQAASLASQILQGADPGTLPVEIAELYQGINLKTAKMIGLEITDEILLKTEIIIREDD